MRGFLFGLSLSVLSMLSVGLSAAETAGKSVSKSAYTVRQKFPLGEAGGWDYLASDAAGHRLFISRSDRVLVMDTVSGQLLTTIRGTAGVHGIALAPELGKGFTSNGRADSVSVFDLESLQISGTIDVQGHNPDAILFDPASRHLYTFNGRSNDVSVIDPVQGKVVVTIPLSGKPEFAAADGAGKIFVNIEDKGQLIAIDTALNKVAASWSLHGCEAPTGLAFDVARHRLFSVCDNAKMVVTDSLSGKQIAVIAIGKGPDAAEFDVERGLIFSSNGADGTLTVIHQVDADHYKVLANIPTQKSARTMALDQSTHRLYLAAAQFGPTPAQAKDQPHPRAPVLDGSFNILVVGD
jgi:YVTN family beta-propeller protein